MLLLMTTGCGLSSEVGSFCERMEAFVASPAYQDVPPPEKVQNLSNFFEGHFTSTDGQRLLAMLASAEPTQKYAVFKNVAKEVGRPQWHCPVLEDLFHPPPPQEIAKLCSDFEASHPEGAKLAGDALDAKLKAFFDVALFRSMQAEEIAHPMTLKPDARFAAVQAHARKYQKNWDCAALRAALAPAKPAMKPLCNDDGQIDKSTLRAYVQKYLTAPVRYCYERALAKQPSLAGKVVTRWTSTKGQVTEVSLDKNELTPEVGECIRKRIEQVKFPKEDNLCTYSVSYPFIFRPG